MRTILKVLEINGDTATLKARPVNIIVKVTRLKFVTTDKSFAEIKNIKK